MFELLRHYRWAFAWYVTVVGAVTVVWILQHQPPARHSSPPPVAASTVTLTPPTPPPATVTVTAPAPSPTPTPSPSPSPTASPARPTPSPTPRPTPSSVTPTPPPTSPPSPSATPTPRNKAHGLPDGCLTQHKKWLVRQPCHPAMPVTP